MIITIKEHHVKGMMVKTVQIKIFGFLIYDETVTKLE